MNEEQLSALVDDELDADHTRGALDALGGDEALRESWGRYHLIGAAIRDAESVTEPASVVALPVRRRSAPLAGLAIAASVAALALALVLLPARDAGQGTPAIAASVAPPAPARVAAVEPQVVSLPAQDPAVSGRDIARIGTHDERLNGYLVNFNEQRARLGVPGVHPYVRIVGFESE